ncbi:uncharacterized protein [Rutidosis leptorrhynchoides]|uniref:uncharacterized protein isoform X2 n=1 Tax=Rutidosis leptorrhynchoides TaxID=125765 RepID=UPI003A992CD3
MNSVNDDRRIVSVEASGIIEECRVQGNNVVSLINSSRSTVKIDSLSIKLGIVKEKGDVQKCSHFSIRGFVAGMREKGSSTFLDFTEELPPMDVPCFRYWSCQGCLRNNATANASANVSHETPLVSVCDQCMVRPGAASCTTQDFNGGAIIPFGEGTSGSKPVDDRNNDEIIISEDIQGFQEIPKFYSVNTNVAEPAKKVSNDVKTHEEHQKTSIENETITSLVSQQIESGQQNDCPNGHPRRKARKVRLLKELLCKKPEIQHQKKENSSPSAGAASSHIKRKVLHDHDHTQSHHVQDHDQSIKVKSLKGSAVGIAKNNVVDPTRDPLASENGETVNKFQWNKPKSSNLGKVGSDAMNAWRSIFNDMGKTGNQVTSTYSVSKGRGTEHYSTFMVPPKPDKKLNAFKKISPKTKFFEEDSRRMKDRQSDTELGLGLSLNYDPQEQVRSLPFVPNRTPNQDHSRKVGFLMGESSNYPNLKEGSVHDVSNRHPPRTSVLQEHRPYTQPLSYGSCSGHQKLDFSNPHKRNNGYSEATRPHNHQRQENMFSIGRSDEREIIELMAKNQYERSLGEVRPQFLPVSDHNAIVVSGFGNVNINEGMSSSRHEYLSMIRPSSENVGPTNMRNPGFMMFDGLRQSQKQPSNGIWMSDSGSQRHYDSHYHHVSNVNNRGGSYTRVFNPTNMQLLEPYNSCNNGPYQNEAVSIPYGQAYANYSDKDKGKNMMDLDLNVVAPNAVDDYNNLDPLSSQNPKHVGSMDSSYVNDAIPAMQLLSLMDAGKSSQPFGADSQKLITKPLSPSYSQCRSTMSGKTNPMSGQNINMGSGHGQQGYHHKPKPQEDKSRGCRPGDSYNTFPLPWHATEDRYKQKQINGVFGSRFDSSVTEMCTVNFNPADFSSPGPGNIYMIGAEDLKYKGKSVLGNANGPKKQKVNRVH